MAKQDGTARKRSVSSDELHDDGSVTLNLQYPIKVNGAPVDSITIRRPKVKDQTRALTAGGSEAEQEMKLFADLCMLTPDAIGELDMDDFTRMRNAYESFLSSRQKLPGGLA